MKIISYKINRNQPHTDKRQLIKIDITDNTAYYNSDHFYMVRNLFLDTRPKIVKKKFK